MLFSALVLSAFLIAPALVLAHGGWTGRTDILLGPEVGYNISCALWDHFPPNPCWHSNEGQGNYWGIDWQVAYPTGVRLHTGPESNTFIWVDYFPHDYPDQQSYSCKGVDIPFWDEAGGAWIKLGEMHFVHMDPDWGGLPPTPPGELLPPGEYSRHLGTIAQTENCPYWGGQHLHQSGGQDWGWPYNGDRHHILDNDNIPNPAPPSDWQHIIF
ncbi:MAG TPA: hypothetical protein VJA25_13400 [Dehalococcoidia bacterium]|nr:hypothetical protein [Dehalococcoidia bacterium]